MLEHSLVQSLSRVWLSETPWIAARQASLSITNSQSSLRLLMMPSSHLILGRPLPLLPPIPPSIRVFSNESTLRIRWPKYWSFSFSIIPSKHKALVNLIRKLKFLSSVSSDHNTMRLRISYNLKNAKNKYVEVTTMLLNNQWVTEEIKMKPDNPKAMTGFLVVHYGCMLPSRGPGFDPWSGN